ncbi:T9SS type A sorting domain-containing protein [uncultured Dokdonia sp.]|uniref:T9SS type A sorting domain-containing protein n=1 Tax=uncultured Dokdonia sp. TaxID=575653 RepID=UPI0026095F3A|nr:T9SS type A sorting domain-containing protein [uncultured Dokdonia sp.]
MKKITSKKLLNYGAMSVALMGIADASGQIVYTDIDPDQAMGPASESFMVDLNGDGTNDFDFQIFNSAGAVMYALSSNGFVGFTASGYNYGSNLTEGTVIDAAASFVTAARADNNFNSCNYPNSQWCGGVTDGYMGLSINVGGETFYGWARLDIIAAGNEMTIKDFAFNSVAGESIMAGEGALSLEDNTIEGFSSFVSDNVLTLNARTPLEAVTIHSISGQKVISQKLSNTTETVNLNGLSTGVYIATVAVEGKLQAIKFVK